MYNSQQALLIIYLIIKHNLIIKCIIAGVIFIVAPCIL